MEPKDVLRMAFSKIAGPDAKDAPEALAEAARTFTRSLRNTMQSHVSAGTLDTWLTKHGATPSPSGFGSIRFSAQQVYAMTGGQLPSATLAEAVKDAAKEPTLRTSVRQPAQSLMQYLEQFGVQRLTVGFDDGTRPLDWDGDSFGGSGATTSLCRTPTARTEPPALVVTFSGPLDSLRP